MSPCSRSAARTCSNVARASESTVDPLSGPATRSCLAHCRHLLPRGREPDWIADSDPTRESLWVAHLDDKAHCVHLTHHSGDESGTDFPLRSIISNAAIHKSAGIVLAHNHPSGDPTPSDGDRRATRRLACAAEALDCTLVDHLVFGDGDCASFRQLGFL